MQELILQYIKQNQMIQKGEHIIVGVSGGADSVCLFHILRQLQAEGFLTISVVHVNHGLRGDAAQEDEEFTRQLAQQYAISYNSVSVNVEAEAKKRGMSIEEAGRVVRREIFEQYAKEKGASKIALGHHADDQAETVLLNLVRGSGLTGLCGINPVRGQYIRPLLNTSKEAIEEYLKAQDYGWQVDETNFSEDYTRNKIRHKALKYLEEINPKASEHIANSAKHLLEIEEYLRVQTKAAYDYYTQVVDDGICIKELLAKENPIIQKRVMRECAGNAVGSLKNLTQKNIEAMTTIFDKETGKQIEIGKGFVIRRIRGAAIVKLAKYDISKNKYK